MTAILIGLALAQAQIDVRGAHFLVFDASRPDAPRETTDVPYRPNRACYHWVLRVAPEQRDVVVRELFELPAPAEQWNPDPGGTTVVGRDGSRAATEITDSIADGEIGHGWCVAEGDPSGDHRIRVYEGDRLLHEFRFRVLGETY
jgi:hypothetical protein